MFFLHISQKSDCEQFAPIAHHKRATGKLCSFSRANRSFALSLTKNEQFAQKTDERISNPASNNTMEVKSEDIWGQ